MPGSYLEFTGCNGPINVKLGRYENSQGIRFWLRENGSGADVADYCFPTFNDTMRLGGRDTDSDMSYLIAPPEMQSLLEMRAVERGGLATRVVRREQHSA